MQDHAIKIKDGGIIVAPWDEDPECEDFGTFGDRMDAMTQGLKVRQHIHGSQGKVLIMAP